jgi:hypothetical protein
MYFETLSPILQETNKRKLHAVTRVTRMYDSEAESPCITNLSYRDTAGI